MGRSRLMEQQRARMKARRARLKKKKADMNKYGSGGKKATTRDTSKDQSKQVLKYGSGGTKGVTRDSSKDTKPAAKKPTPKPAGVKPAKPSAQANKGSGRDGKFGTGTYGKGRPSDAKLAKKPTQKPSTKKQTRGGLRAAVTRKKRDYAAGAREVSERARRMNRNPISIPSKPPKNPKEGDVYKRPYGPLMIYKNGKFVRK